MLRKASITRSPQDFYPRVIHPAARRTILTTAHPQYQVRALERSLQILGAFSLEQPELSLSDLSMATDLPPSTALRLLTILAQFGYVEKSPDTDRYRIGVGMFERGSIYIQSTTVEAEAAGPLEALARETNQTASLGVLDRTDIVHIAVYQPDRAIRYYAPVGQREMAHCTGLGKALLSGLRDEEVEEIVAQRGLPGRTDRTITTISALRANLSEIRERGHAIDNEESIVGLRCVAAPIFDDRNRVVAAISASGAASEFDESTMPVLIEAITKTAALISDRLGHRVQKKPA
jgi:DNA-binding IclR family transcriptional regulator